MRTAIVTGGANGIGKAIVLHLLKENYSVCVIDKIETAFTEKNIHFFKCDISIELEIINLFNEIKSQFSKIDVLINNAGIIRDNVIWKMTLTEFEAVININLKGTWLMCREVAKIMKEQKSGHIINISSRAWLGNPGQTNYSASKAGIIGLTRSLALELSRYQVMVNAIAPGLIDTSLSQSLSEEVRNKLIQAQPTKTMGTPDDIAQVVSFLCSEKNHFITGQVIYVDGGKSIGANMV